MRFMKWAVAAAAVAGMALIAGCGGSGDGGNADVRLINASVGYPSLNMTVNSNAVGTNVAYGAASSYSSQDVTKTITISNAATGSTLLQPGLSTTLCGARCSIIAYGWADATLSRVILQENNDQPAAGFSLLNVQDLAPDAGSVDVYLDSSTSAPLTAKISSGLTGGAGTGFLTYTAGTYTVTITGAGNPADIRLQIPNVSLPALQVATMLLTSGSGGTSTAVAGGVLVNGILAVQGGALSTFAGSTARVRVVGTLAGTAPTVSATRGTGNVVLLSQQVAPAIGAYKTISAGSDPITVLVNGAPMTVITPAFVAGGDYTLMVWGNSSDPKIAVIADDNRLPTTIGTAKIRLFNGLANAAPNSGLTLTINSQAFADNVLPGTASLPDYPTASIQSNGFPLAVTSPTFGVTNLIDLGNPGDYLPIVVGGVYEVFMTGDGSSVAGIQGIVRLQR